MVAMIATLLVACGKEVDEGLSENKTALHQITVTVADDDTRTVLREAEGYVAWSTGDKLCVIERNFEEDSKYDLSAISSEANIQNGKASFGVSFIKNDYATSFAYNAFSPADCSYYVDRKNKDIFYLSIPNPQNSTTTSFDPKADILVAKQIETTEQPESLCMQFKRVVAMNKMMLSGLPSNITIDKVSFSAAGKALTGDLSVNLPTGSVDYTASGISKDAIIINYDEPIASSSAIYFNSFPLELTEGDSFEVKVTCGNTIYTKSVTLKSGQSLTLKAGHLNSFTIDLSAVSPYVPKTYSPGDLYNENGVKGVIFAVKQDFNQITWCYIMSLDEEDLQWSTEYANCNNYSAIGYYNTYYPFTYYGMDINKYPAFKWCMDHGEGWFMPSSTELTWMWDAISNGSRDFLNPMVEQYNKILKAYGGEPFVETYYWSSNETSEEFVELVAFMKDSVVCLDPKKDNKYTVRAAYRFKIA